MRVAIFAGRIVACRRAIVATDVTGSNEVVRPGVNGYLFKVGDVKAGAQQVERVIAELSTGDRFSSEPFVPRILSVSLRSACWIACRKAIWVELHASRRHESSSKSDRGATASIFGHFLGNLPRITPIVQHTVSSWNISPASSHTRQ